MEQAKESIVSPALPNDSNDSFIPKLPLIDIPKFNGDILVLLYFKILWENLIHNHPKMTGVQKLFYMNQAVAGTKVEEIIGDFPIKEN